MPPRSDRLSADDGRLIELGRASIAALVLSAACGGTAADDPGPSLLKEDTELLGYASAKLSDLGLECTLWPSESSDRYVTMTVENHGDMVVELLTRGTLWDGLSRVLDVRRDATDLPYVGILSTRGDPVESEFLGIPPGEAISVAYDLAYNYEVRSAGRLELSLASPVLDIRLSNELLSVQHDCGQLSAIMDPDATPMLGSAEQPLIWEVAPYEPCTAAQQATVANREVIARGATTIGASLIGANGLYDRWFGTPTPANLTIVNEVFTSVQSNWDIFTGECDTDAVDAMGNIICNGSVNAWVRRTGAGSPTSDPDLVHLCAPYFALPSLSVEADSNQVGVLVHEKSHLNSGTVIRDESNGTLCSNTCNTAAEARALANNDLAQAVTNAENYEHFVSNAYIVAAIVAPTGPLLQ